MSEVKKKSKIIDLGFLTVSMLKSNIVYLKFKLEGQVNVDGGIKILESIESITKGASYASIIDGGNLYVPSNDFFKFILSQRNLEKDKIVARAIITTNTAQMLDAQNFISLYKPMVPTKLFSVINNEVFDWIDSHLK